MKYFCSRYNIIVRYTSYKGMIKNLLSPQHVDIYSASWGPDDDGRTVSILQISPFNLFYTVRLYTARFVPLSCWLTHYFVGWWACKTCTKSLSRRSFEWPEGSRVHFCVGVGKRRPLSGNGHKISTFVQVQLSCKLRLSWNRNKVAVRKSLLVGWALITTKYNKFKILLKLY